MNEVLNCIKTRRSIKKYKSDAVPTELIEKIIEAGTYAPSGMNKQSAIIVAIENKEVRDNLSKINAEIMGTTNNPFYNAPVLLVVLAKKDFFTHVYDGSVVIENMLLAAHSLGLGACWIHRAKETFETEYGKNLLKSLGIEEEYEGIGNCVIGYPDMEPIEKPRKENYVYYVK